MSDWEGPTRWVNTVLLVIVGVIGFDTLFELLEANQENVIVGTIDSFAGVLLAPFRDMFSTDDPAALTALVAVLAYSLAAGILLAIIRATQASVPRRRRVAYEDERHAEYDEPPVRRTVREPYREQPPGPTVDPPATVRRTPATEEERTRIVRGAKDDDEPTRVVRPFGEDEPTPDDSEHDGDERDDDGQSERRTAAGPTPLWSPTRHRGAGDREQRGDADDDRTQQL